MGTTTVETRHGRLEGKQGGSVLQWRGVPFAAPPVGPLRFLPPQPPAPWAGVRDATQFGSPSAQPASPMEAMFGAGAGPLGEEDCLYLNVFAPAEPESDRLPVMCWIHGGAFTGGSGSTPWYDGSRFAGSGRAVVVTINYRLGALGFTHFGSSHAAAGGEAWAFAGNCGILDQVAALEWIRDNIEAFGGDPERVTVFGESAGSMSIATLLGLPAAKGLFHQAILQSGAANVVRSPDRGAAVTAALLGELGCSAKELGQAPVGAILEAQKAVSASQGSSSTLGSGLAFAPVVDGTGLPRHPLEAIREGAAAGIRTLVGTNRDEATLFIAFDPAAASLDREALGARLSRVAGSEWRRFVEGYEASRPGALPFDLLAAVLTDSAFRIPAIDLASAQVSAGAEAWMYRFDWPSPAFGGRLRATHALDLPFVWDILGTKGVSMFTGEDAPVELARRMHADWLSFACGEAPDWPRYDVATRPTMVYDTECRVVEDPDGAERALWHSA